LLKAENKKRILKTEKLNNVEKVSTFKYKLETVKKEENKIQKIVKNLRTEFVNPFAENTENLKSEKISGNFLKETTFFVCNKASLDVPVSKAHAMQECERDVISTNNFFRDEIIVAETEEEKEIKNFINLVNIEFSLDTNELAFNFRILEDFSENAQLEKSKIFFIEIVDKLNSQNKKIKDFSSEKENEYYEKNKNELISEIKFPLLVAKLAENNIILDKIKKGIRIAN